MPIYDCGAPECDECQQAFGPDRSKAIATYKAREIWFEAISGAAKEREAAELERQ